MICIDPHCIFVASGSRPLGSACYSSAMRSSSTPPAPNSSTRGPPCSPFSKTPCNWQSHPRRSSYYSREYYLSLLRFTRAGHRSPLCSCVSSCWNHASVYVRLSAVCLRIYAATKGRSGCAYFLENNACVRKNTSCSGWRMFYFCIQSPVTEEMNTLVTKCSELIGNAEIVRKRNVIHKKAPYGRL